MSIEKRTVPGFKRSLLAAAVLAVSASAGAADGVKMGALATLEGAFTVLGEDGMRGVKMALAERDNKACGQEIELITGSSDASPDSAIRAARKLVEQDKVEILIGPLSGSEGLAVKDYAKTQPQVTFESLCWAHPALAARARSAMVNAIRFMVSPSFYGSVACSN